LLRRRKLRRSSAVSWIKWRGLRNSDSGRRFLINEAPRLLVLTNVVVVVVVVDRFGLVDQRELSLEHLAAFSETSGPKAFARHWQT